MLECPLYVKRLSTNVLRKSAKRANLRKVLLFTKSTRIELSNSEPLTRKPPQLKRLSRPRLPRSTQLLLVVKALRLLDNRKPLRSTRLCQSTPTRTDQLITIKSLIK